MKHPHEHRRRILVAVTGLSPQVLTETLYALAVKAQPAFVPTEIRLITTEDGARGAELSLLHPESGWFHRLCADYELPPIAFGTDQIHVLKDTQGGPLRDIRSPEDNTRAADVITEVVRELTQDSDSALHVSIAGGRKTMGFYLGYALSLYGREQDRLSHVLVSAHYESNPDFFYPTPYSRVIHTAPPNRQPLDTRDAKVTLADIPFVRLREGLDPQLMAGETSFSAAVADAQRALDPPELTFDLPNRRICAGGVLVTVSPSPLAFLAWLARRRKQGLPWVRCPSDGAPDDAYGADFLREYRFIIGEMGDDESTARRLGKGMTNEFFSQTKSKLHRQLRQKLGVRGAEPYLVAARGNRANRRYGLELPPRRLRLAATGWGRAGGKLADTDFQGRFRLE